MTGDRGPAHPVRGDADTRGPSAGETGAREPWAPWVLPFAAFMLLLAVLPFTGLPPLWDLLLRLVLPAVVLLAVSRGVLRTLRLRAPLASILLGVATCALWVAPDTLFDGWRSHWLFQNALTGDVAPTIDPALFADWRVIALRIARATLLVPLVEELFWRGWLTRWLVSPDTRPITIGTFTPFAFVVSAALFATVHGPYWEVALLCGLTWNWWLSRTRSLGDLVLVHAVTNGCLAAWVLWRGEFAYWM